MPNWFKRQEEELPPELKDLTPAQAAEKIKKLEAAEAKAKKLEEERDSEKQQVVQMNNEFQNVKNKLVEVEANYNKLKNPPRVENQEPADWLTDPQAAFNQGVQPLADLTIRSSAMTARMLALQQLDNEDANSSPDSKTVNGRLFRAWESEINDETRKYPAAQMISPDRWIAVFYMIKGRHSDELTNPETRKKKYNFLESGSNGAPPRQEEKKTGVEALTAEEKRVADRMGVSHENYAKRKEKMTFATV